MNKEEIIKSLQHTIDWMEQHGANGISVTQHTGCGGYKEVDTLCDKIALKEAIKALEIIRDLEKALPTICATQFEVYAYYKVLELDEAEE